MEYIFLESTSKHMQNKAAISSEHGFTNQRTRVQRAAKIIRILEQITLKRRMRELGLLRLSKRWLRSNFKPAYSYLKM